MDLLDTQRPWKTREGEGGSLLHANERSVHLVSPGSSPWDRYTVYLRGDHRKLGFPGSSAGEESACNQCWRPGFDLWLGKIPWRKAWQPTPVFLPEEPPWTEEPSGLQSMGSQRVGHNLVTKHRIGNHDDWGSGWARQWGRNTGKRWKSVKQNIYLWADHPGKGSSNPPLTSGIREPFLTWLKIVTPKGREADVVSHHLPFLIIPGDINSLELWAQCLLMGLPMLLWAEKAFKQRHRRWSRRASKHQDHMHDRMQGTDTQLWPFHPVRNRAAIFSAQMLSAFQYRGVLSSWAFPAVRYEHHSTPRTCQVWNKSFQDSLIHLASFCGASLWTRNSSVTGDTTVLKKMCI